jgi:predicted dehydrogenase
MARNPHQTVTIGIVGAGIWGGNHALALASHPHGHIAVICDQDAGRAWELAERVGCAWTTSLDEVAASDVEAVTIATPDHLHRDPTLAMLRAGKHVLVEKPLATSVAAGTASRR